MVCAKPAKILYMDILYSNLFFVVCSAFLHYDDDCPINNIDKQAERGAVPIHLKQQRASAKAWVKLRGPLLQAVVEARVPLSCGSVCASCQSRIAVVVCADCGPSAVYCEDCTKTVHLHQHIFRRSQHWKVCNSYIT